MRLLPSIQATVVTAGSKAEIASDTGVLPAVVAFIRSCRSQHSIAVPMQHAIWFPTASTGGQQAVHIVIESCLRVCARMQHAKHISDGLGKHASDCVRQARHLVLQKGHVIRCCEQVAHVKADGEAAQNKQEC
jgi:hypothetical protein